MYKLDFFFPIHSLKIRYNIVINKYNKLYLKSQDKLFKIDIFTNCDKAKYFLRLLIRKFQKIRNLKAVTCKRHSNGQLA